MLDAVKLPVFINGENMKVLVPVKRVMDAYVKPRIKSDGSGIEENKMSINPFDEIAVEEAVSLKEKGIVSEVILVSIGDKSVQETIRHGLALGADKGIHVSAEVSLDPLNIAKILKNIALRESVSLVVMGKQAIDNDNNQTGQMLAGLLDWPQHTFASQLTIENETLTVVREVDGGLETLFSKLPAVVTTDLRLNEPRYASLPNIMKAKRKPLETLELEAFDINLIPRFEVLSYEAPAKREAGVMLSSTDELIAKLKVEFPLLGEKDKL